MIARLLLLSFGISTLFSFTACDTQTEVAHKEATAPKIEVVVPTKFLPFKDSMQPVLYETPAGALATWKNYSSQKPAMLLFANHPLLAPLTDEDRDAALSVINTGVDSEIVRRGSILVPDPAFLPPQTLSVAIAADMISELVYVMPSKAPIELFSLENFQKRAYQAGFLSEEEARSLTLKEGVISGNVRGIPFRCVHPDAVFAIDKPSILHIDLGYFSELYVNGVKTRPYDLLYDLAVSIKERNLPTLAATLSYSNQEIDFSLESRFVISALNDILSHPEFLAGGTPASWTHRSNALYYNEMFNEDEARKLIRKAAESNPEDPAALFDLANLEFQGGKTVQGFALLDKAIHIDKGYGLAYIELAERGLQMAEFEKSIELLQRAAEKFPDNVFIRINLADILIQNGRAKEARETIAELRALPWSERYHQGMKEMLKQMAEVADNDSIKPQIDLKKKSTQQVDFIKRRGPFHMGEHGHSPKE